MLSKKEYEKLCKECLKAIGTKSDKDEYAKKLGILFFEQFGKYDDDIEEKLYRIKSNRYKISAIASFLGPYYRKNGKDFTEETVDKDFITPSNFIERDDDTNRIKARVYIQLDIIHDWEVADSVYFLVIAGKYIKEIEEIDDKVQLQKSVGRRLKAIGDIKEVLQAVKDSQRSEYDNLPEDIYKINDNPEKMEDFVSLFPVEPPKKLNITHFAFKELNYPAHLAFKEVNYRAHLDWFIWYILTDLRLLKTNPEIYFEFLLNLSRCSDYNREVKEEYLGELRWFLSDLVSTNRVDLIKKLIDINHNYTQSENWKNRIGAILMKS